MMENSEFDIIVFIYLMCGAIFILEVLLILWESSNKARLRRDSILDPNAPRKPRGFPTCLILSEKRCQVGKINVIERMDIRIGCGYPNGPTYWISIWMGQSRHPVPLVVDSGCTISIVSLREVEKCGLLDLLDKSDKTTIEAMGGITQKTSGMLKVPITTSSGVTILQKIAVAEMGVDGGMLGLDVLSAFNCSVVMDDANPMLVIRKRKTQCCGICSYRNGADVMAKLDGKLMHCILDTGSLRTVVGPSLHFDDVSMSWPVKYRTAAKEKVEARRKIRNLRIEMNGNVGYTSPMVINERIPLIGTDFLRNMRIDFICGRAYVTKC